MSSDPSVPSTPVPSATLRDRLMSSLQDGSRFAPFADPIAALLDVDPNVAMELLARIEQPEAFSASGLANVEFRWVEGGPQLNNMLTGFVRMPAFAHFPVHRHLGQERVFILQGSCMEDQDGTILRSGETSIHDAGTSHSFTVRPGPDLVYFAAVERGVEIENGPRLVAGNQR